MREAGARPRPPKPVARASGWVSAWASAWASGWASGWASTSIYSQNFNRHSRFVCRGTQIGESCSPRREQGARLQRHGPATRPRGRKSAPFSIPSRPRVAGAARPDSSSRRPSRVTFARNLHVAARWPRCSLQQCNGQAGHRAKRPELSPHPRPRGRPCVRPSRLSASAPPPAQPPRSHRVMAFRTLWERRGVAGHSQAQRTARVGAWPVTEPYTYPRAHRRTLTQTRTERHTHTRARARTGGFTREAHAAAECHSCKA